MPAALPLPLQICAPAGLRSRPCRPTCIATVPSSPLLLPPTCADLMNRLGLYLRSRKLAPDVQLKRFIQQHCAGRVVVIES